MVVVGARRPAARPRPPRSTGSAGSPSGPRWAPSASALSSAGTASAEALLYVGLAGSLAATALYVRDGVRAYRELRQARNRAISGRPAKICGVKAVVMAGGEGTRLRPADLQPAQADGARRGQAVHGAHRRARAPPRHHERGRDARLHAAGDPRLLRRGLAPRRRARLLGRGGARRHRRQREAARALPGRDLPGGERRRAHRHGPLGADRVPPLQRRGRDARAEAGPRPARVRRRDHRPRTGGSSASSRSRPGARSSRTRSTPASTCSSPRCCAHIPRRPAVSTSRRSCSRRLLERGRAALRLDRRRLLAGHREPRSSTRRPTATRSTARSSSRSPGVRLRDNVWVGEGSLAENIEQIAGPGRDRQLLRDRRDARRSAATRCSATT